MNEFVMHKSQKNFEQALKRLERAELSPKVKRDIENFGRIRLAKGSTKLRVVKCLYCLRFLAKWLGKDFASCNASSQHVFQRRVSFNSALYFWVFQQLAKCNFGLLLFSSFQNTKQTWAFHKLILAFKHLKTPFSKAGC